MSTSIGSFKQDKSFACGDRQAELERAVSSICPDIQSRMRNTNPANCETVLWQELICCILSSQVSYAVAQQAARRLICSGMFPPKSDYNFNNVESKLRDMLRAPLVVNGKRMRYRFPNLKANQIAALVRRFVDKNYNISAFICRSDSPVTIRSILVKELPGVGLKQASMFLRNIGKTYDLAIIDRHVFNYMTKIHLVVGFDYRKLSRKVYLTMEQRLIQYAHKLGYPVGCVDWAIWIVMRVARQEGYA